MNWKPIKNYEDRYEVSDCGDVRSMKKKPPYTLKPLSHGAGYLAVNLYSGGKSTVKKCYIHDLVAEAFIDPKPKGLTVNHKDGVKTNNAVSNLEYLSLADNLRHAHRTGLIDNKGEKHWNAKLTEQEVSVIWSGVYSGWSMGETAQSFGVTVATVWSIANGKSWVHHTSTLGLLAVSGMH